MYRIEDLNTDVNFLTEENDKTEIQNTLKSIIKKARLMTDKEYDDIIKADGQCDKCSDLFTDDEPYEAGYEYLCKDCAGIGRG